MLVQLYNYFGEYKKASETEEAFLELISKLNNTKRATKPLPKESTIDSLVMVPAIQAIEEAAADHQVIMINEEHRTTLHRELTLELLPVLYSKGFRYLHWKHYFQIRTVC